jgi:hypothetical protein
VPFRRGVPILALLLGACLTTSTKVVASDDASHQILKLSFAIPVQPLASALDSYGSATGLEIVYNSTLAVNRRSSDVHGVYTPEAALSVLLKGSGLTARPIGVGTVTIVPAAISQPIQAPSPGAGPYRTYLAAIQHGFENSFCHSENLSPRNYRTIVKFNIGADGKILHPQLIGSTGSALRDEAIAQTLVNLTFDTPPPDLPQPVMMLILPQSSGYVLNCSSPN